MISYPTPPPARCPATTAQLTAEARQRFKFHAEGSAALQAQVEDWKTLVYQGQAAALVERLRDWLQQVPLQGPGTKGRRQTLTRLLG